MNKRKTPYPICGVDGCPRDGIMKALCDKHYYRWKTHGDVRGGRIMFDDEARFRSYYVVAENGCHVWQGATRSQNGYGRFRTMERIWLAHVWAWVQVNGPVPAGLVMDHFRYPQDGCVGRGCVNPEHVRPVTPRENTIRGKAFSPYFAGRFHCKRGHAWTVENTYVSPAGFRVCRTCTRAGVAAFRERRREAA